MSRSPPLQVLKARVRVLLLEDSAVEADRLLEWLALPGRSLFEVLHVSTLEAALAALRSQDFDVALIDLCVDDSRGLGTFEACHLAAPELPLVVQSGLDLEDLAVQAVAGGAQDYLVKRHMTQDLLRRSLHYAIERKAAERQLLDSRERYRLAIEGANDGIWDWDIAGGELFTSDRWCEMLGYGRQDVGSDVEDWLALVHPRDRDALISALDAHLEGHSHHFEVEHRMLHRSGSWRWVRTRGLAVRDASGRASRMAGSQSDVTARRESEARLLHQALHDGLTDLPNRTLFLDRLEHAVERSGRQDSRGFGVLFLDLDRFKVVNDSLGHLAGDQLLVAVAQRLRECVRPGDTVARLGGDEFGVLVEELSGSGMAEEIATRIHRSVAQPVALRGQSVFPTVSIGIARYQGGEASAESLLRQADIAMYRAKKAGRACSEVFDEALHAWAMGRLSLENGLRRAVERDEFVVHYQPIVRLADASLVGFEALIRWESPERGLMRPDEFIPLAEETGLINPVGRWVLRKACLQIAELNRSLPAPHGVSVSVNVSSRQLAQEGFADEVEEALDDTGLDPKRLVLELTETALMENPVRAAELLTRLRSHGIRVHLDDFGAGYSSLGYLRRFPIDRLKIDRAFVQGVTSRHEDDAIIRAILGLSEALGLEVIAEGVENLAQRDHLSQLKCMYGQGFYFSRPVDIQTTTRLARQHLLDPRVLAQA